MKPDQWIALLASVGACLSALATFLTVRQIAKQREATYRPELAISRVHFKANPNPVASGALPTMWGACDTKAMDTPINLEDLPLPLRNIGLGAARAVDLQWSFDLAGTARLANDLARRALIPAYFRVENENLSIKSPDLGNGTSMWRNQRQIRIDFVLPSSVEKEPVPVRLPHAYVTLVAALVYLTAKVKDGVHSVELPSLTAAFTYNDIGGGGHEQIFEVKTHLVMLSGGGDWMTGYVECAKCT